jgi:prepilin-type N-terminal cleavage/methylation domain-containing protein
MNHRRGITLIELLVAIAIIGILVALLLPAVQSAREAARRSQCQNNLKQIGMALQLYHDVHSVFPRGAYPASGSSGGWEAHGNGPFTMLLPYMEQRALYDQWNFSTAMTGASNNVLAEKTHIDVFLCPSDFTPSACYAGNNYALSTGPNVAWTTIPSEALGVAGVRVSHGLRDILDGTSQTILAAEIIKGDGDNGIQGGKFSEGDVIRGVPWTIRRIKPTAQELRQRDALCRTAFGYGNHHGQGGWYWFQPHPYDSMFNTISPPNPPYANCVDQSIYHDTDGAGLFPSRSYHSGGAMHVFCDGSVRFMADSTEHVLYQGLGTIAGREVIDAFD